MSRLFIGINLGENKRISAIYENLKAALRQSKIAWVDPRNFHITLKFLGEVESFYIQSISMLLGDVCRKFDAFELEYHRLGYFGPIHQPQVIWFGFNSNPAIASLQKSIEKSLNELGFEIEEKKFKPHLTFGRVKQLIEQDAFREIMNSHDQINGRIAVGQFQLIESILKKEGPEYRVLQTFKLGI